MVRFRKYENDSRTPLDATRGVVTGKGPGYDPMVSDVVNTLDMPTLRGIATSITDGLQTPTGILPHEKGSM